MHSTTMRRHGLTASAWITLIVFSLLVLTGCARSDNPSHNADTAVDANVNILTPVGNNSLDPNVPINTWSHVDNALEKAFTQYGIASSHIAFEHTRNTQAQVEHVDAIAAQYKKSGNRNTPHILVIAPNIDNESEIEHMIRVRYGDLVTLPSLNNDDPERAEALSSLAESLTQAQSAGVHVVVLANEIPGFTPDYFVSLNNATRIARIVTNNLVRKLNLSEATRENPKAIEILLPVNAGANFNEELFTAAWKILKPYFDTGVAYSPSELLDSQTRGEDWRNISFVDDSKEGVADVLRARLTLSNGTIANVDGVLAFNDYTANGVTFALTQLGFTGSSANINPDISLDAIMKNLVGHADVNRQAIPDPQSHDDSQSHSLSPQSDQQQTLTWPIVTGYGSYINTVKDIVNGKVWISALESREEIAKSIALLAISFTSQSSEQKVQEKLPGLSHGRLSLRLFAVNADNFKKALLDTGYISPADAGL